VVTALTADTWKDRLLGGNKGYDGPLHVVWYATGNNVQLKADTSRRTCHIRLESPDERPEAKSDFKYPKLREHARANRVRLLSAALTILRGWFVAGRPTHGLPAWGSFEGWSGVVREAVVFAGLPDPGDTRLALQTSADQDAVAMRIILRCLKAMDPERQGVTTAQVIDTLKSTPPSPPTWHAELRTAIEDLCGKLDSSKLGYKFRHFARRNFDGQMLDTAGTTAGSNRWLVVSVSARRPNDVPNLPDPPSGLLAERGDEGDREDVPAGSGRFHSDCADLKLSN
jgi:hypothetical protein